MNVLIFVQMHLHTGKVNSIDYIGLVSAWHLMQT